MYWKGRNWSVSLLCHNAWKQRQWFVLILHQWAVLLHWSSSACWPICLCAYVHLIISVSSLVIGSQPFNWSSFQLEDFNKKYNVANMICSNYLWSLFFYFVLLDFPGMSIHWLLYFNICLLIASSVLGSFPAVGLDYFLLPTNWAACCLDEIQGPLFFKRLYVARWSLKECSNRSN